MTRKTSASCLRQFLLPVYLGAVVFCGLGVPVKADTIEIVAPGGFFTGNALGNNDRGTVFDVLNTFSITSAGIVFDPIDGQGGATEISVAIFGVTTPGDPPLGTRNLPALATATAPVVDAGLVFHDVPIAFTFIAGNRYNVAFDSVTPAGWGTARNTMQFTSFTGGVDTPFTVSLDGTDLMSVLGSSFGDNFAHNNLPHIRFETETVVPEPSTLMLLGAGLIAMGVARWRLRSKQTAKT